LDETVPSPRPLTVEDLLTFRLGFGMPPAPLDAYPVQRAEAALGTRVLGPPVPPTELDLDTWLARLGSLPLMAAPGERWLYSAGSHVLGALLARATGTPLDRLLRDRVLAPLAMHDTAFVAADPSRLGPQLDAAGAVVDPPDGQWAVARPLPDAAAGLVSTAADYLRFGRMLLAGGAPVLPEALVAAMVTDHLTAAQRADAAWLLDGRGWGYGLAVRTGERPPGAPGGAGWDGGFGTTWAVDPIEDLVGVCLTARLGTHEPSPVHRAFWDAAYA
jgi:CubicO group peptidase (beta-lactamase class C family)